MTLQYALQRLTFRHWAHYVRSYSMVFTLIIIVKPQLASRIDDVHPFVCLSVCLSVCACRQNAKTPFSQKVSNLEV